MRARGLLLTTTVTVHGIRTSLSLLSGSVPKSSMTQSHLDPSRLKNQRSVLSGTVRFFQGVSTR